MRERIAIFFGAAAALAILTGPSFARTSEAPKSDGKPPSASCSVYQQLPDGSWAQAPCQEVNSPRPANQMTSTKSSGKTSN
jgi:hypothetical protein